MITSQFDRFSYIMRELEFVGKVEVAEMASRLKVTPETIRRDLDVLEEDRKLKRVYGGAIKFSQTQKEAHFNKKMNVQYYEKKEIGKKAAEFIHHNDTIMIDVGTTTIHIAEHLVGVQRLTIVTNSLAAAEMLNRQIEQKLFDGRVIVLGGMTHPEQKSVSGTLTCEMLQHFQFDKAFISCGGISEESVSDYDLEESIVSSYVVKKSNEVFLLADATKLNNQSFYSICQTSEVDYIICDKPQPSSWKVAQKHHKINWIEVKGRD